MHEQRERGVRLREEQLPDAGRVMAPGTWMHIFGVAREGDAQLSVRLLRVNAVQFNTDLGEVEPRHRRPQAIGFGEGSTSGP